MAQSAQSAIGGLRARIPRPCESRRDKARQPVGWWGGGACRLAVLGELAAGLTVQCNLLAPPACSRACNLALGACQGGCACRRSKGLGGCTPERAQRCSIRAGPPSAWAAGRHKCAEPCGFAATFCAHEPPVCTIERAVLRVIELPGCERGACMRQGLGMRGGALCVHCLVY